MRSKPGDIVRIGSHSFRVIKQVLFNIPAYRIKQITKGHNGTSLEFVCDGCLFNKAVGVGDALAILAKPAPEGHVPTLTTDTKGMFNGEDIQ